MSRLEGSVEDSFVTYVEACGAMALKMKVPGRRGWPDRMVLARGPVIFFIEFKRVGARPRKGEKLQRYIQKILKGWGFHVYQTDSLEEAKEIFEREIRTA